MECLPRPSGNIKMLISTRRDAAKKSLCCRKWYVSFGYGFPKEPEMLLMIPFPDFRLDPKLTITIMCKVSLLAACFHFHFHFSFAAKLKISREIFCGCFCCCCSHRHVAPANKFICLNTTAQRQWRRHSPRGAALRTAPARAPVPCSLLLLHLQAGIWLRWFPFPNCRHKVFPFFCIIVVLYLIWFFGHTPRIQQLPLFGGTWGIEGIATWSSAWWRMEESA